MNKQRTKGEERTKNANEPDRASLGQSIDEQESGRRMNLNTDDDGECRALFNIQTTRRCKTVAQPTTPTSACADNQWQPDLETLSVVAPLFEFTTGRQWPPCCLRDSAQKSASKNRSPPLGNAPQTTKITLHRFRMRSALIP